MELRTFFSYCIGDILFTDGVPYVVTSIDGNNIHLEHASEEDISTFENDGERWDSCDLDRFLGDFYSDRGI